MGSCESAPSDLFDLLVTVCRTQYISTTSCFKPSVVWTFKETLMFSGMRRAASSPAPQFGSVERSISARRAFEFGSLTNRAESAERIMSPTKRVVDNTRSAVLDVFEYLVNDNDNDNDTQRSPTFVNEGLDRHECRGHDPAKRRIC